MSKRLFLALALLLVATATSVSAQSSFIVDNRTGSDILIANGSDGNIGIGQRNPGAQLDILSDNPQVAFRVEANNGETWLVNQNGGLQNSRGPRIVTDSNIADEAYTDLEDTFITSGDDGSSDYDIVLNPSGDGRVNVSSNLNIRDNNVTNFFDNRCQEQEVVDGIDPDGTYQCVNVSSEIDVENLSETLQAGNVANQTIDMDDNNIVNIGKLDFDSGNPEFLNPSDNSIRLRGTGGASGNIFDVVEDSSGNTVALFGDGTVGSEIRNPSSNEDIIRFNHSGGSNVEIPNGQLNISTSNALNIDSGSTRLYSDSLRLSNGYGSNGANLSTNDGLRLDAGGPSSDGSIDFQNVGIQENSGELELTGGDTRTVGGNLILDNNNITQIEELQDYYDSEQCGEFRAVKGIYPNGTYICTEEILEEKTEGLNETLDAGNFAGPRDIYLNGSEINDVGTGLTNFTNDGGVDLGGDIEMNGLNIHNTGNSLALDFDSDKVNVRGGLDIENDSRFRNDQELEFGTDTNYDLRLDSTSGNLVLRNGSNQILVADSDENLRVENGYLNLNENNIRNVEAIQDNSQTDSLVFDESNNLAVPNGDLDLENNQINDTSRLKNDGQLVLESDSQNAESGDLLLQTGGSERIQVLNDGEVRVPNSNLNLSQNQLDDVSRIDFENGANTAYIEEQSGDQLAINSQGDVLRLQSANSNDISAESNVEMNENNIQNIGSIQDNSATDSLVFQENNSVVVPNGNLDLQQNDIDEYFDSNCPTGDVVQRVYANGSYRCLDIDDGDNAQSLDEVLDVGNEAVDDNINMSNQDIVNVDQIEINDDGDAPDRQLIQVGDEAYLSDIDESNTLGIQGQQDSSIASVELGESGPTINGETSGDTTFSGNIEANGNNVTEVDEISGNSEAIESQNDVNMSDNDVNEARSINFGNGEDGKRLVKTNGGDLCLGDQC